MYEQVIAPEYPFPYVGGWCEGFVGGSFGQSTPPKQDAYGNWYTTGPYPSAMSAWNANVGGGNHPNEQPPAGVYAPVYFTLGNVPAGHVAYTRPDGTVVSSTQGGYHSAGFIHPNLQHLIDTYSNPAYGNGKCTYLGWKEFVGNARVIKKKEDNAVIPTRQEVEDSFAAFGDTAPKNATQLNYYTGQDSSVLLKDMRSLAKPSAKEVTDTFTQLYPEGLKDPQLIPYYTNRSRFVMYKNIANALAKQASGEFVEVTETLYKKKG